MTTARLRREAWDDRARPVPGPTPGAGGLATAMIVLGAAVVGVLVALVVGTHLGQRADERSRWSVAVPTQLHDQLVRWLGFVDVPLVATVSLAAAAVALLRRRPATALAALVLVAGANLTTQLLKAAIPRPSYGVGPDANSLPSGHTTVMLSLFLVAILVLPRAVRAPAVLAAAAAGTVTGAATILERWHRPSDVIAAAGVCLAWAGVAVAIVHLASRGASASAPVPAPPSGASRAALYAFCGVVGSVLVGAFLVVGGLVAHGTEPGNVVVGGVMLTGTGLACAVVAAMLATACDLLPAQGRPRGVAGERAV